METRKCIKCNQDKELNQYNAYRNECQQCMKVYRKDKYKTNIFLNRKQARDRARENKPERIEYRKIHSKSLEGRFTNWKAQAKKRGIEFNITIKDLTIMPLTCYYTNVELTLEKHQHNTISLDRLDSSKGYVIGNIVFCCTMINWMKQEYNFKEFVDMCIKIAENKERLLTNTAEHVTLNQLTIT